MAYVALYRQWRPQNFDTLVGQKPVKTALKNALATGRIAHAYLFSGPRGTGKTSTARILAKALNCEQGPTAEPCGECDNCKRITEGTSMDVFEIDAASNRGIDEIKTLRDQLAFTPVDSRYKVYIIDEVHMLTTEAFNALLKTLEEPPAHVIFILATTDPHKIPATIHSRCQRFEFRRVTIDEIVEHLTEVAAKSGLAADEEALRLIAIQSEGGMRDALSLLDQCGVMNKQINAAVVREVLGIVGREALRELVTAIGKKELAPALAKFNELLAQGKDVRQVLAELAEYLRAVLLCKTVPSYEEIYLTDTKEELQKIVPLFGSERLMAAEERIHAALLELKTTMRARITAELCLFDICRVEGSTLAALTARVEQLERQVAYGVPVALPEPEPPAPVSDGRPPLPPEPPHEVFKQTAVAEPKPLKASEPQRMASQAAAGPQRAASQPVAPQRVAAKPVASKLTPPAPAAPVTEYGGDWAAGEDYWKQTMQILQDERKNSYVSFAKNARVYSFENNILTLTFKAPFFAKRINEDKAYRETFEAILLRLARKPVRLQALTEEEAKAQGQQQAAPIAQAVPVQQASAAKAEAPVSLNPSEVPDGLRKAMNAFGGSVTEV